MSNLLIEEPRAILMAQAGTRKISRQELALVATPNATATHKPISHIDVVNALMETLKFRNIQIIRDEYAISSDGMKMFGVADLSLGFEGCRFSIGLRNSNDKSIRLGLTVGYRVAVCSNMAFQGDFTPLLAKHSPKFELLDALSIGVDRIQRAFIPLQEQVSFWQSYLLSDVEAKALIYEAFIEGALEVPKHLIKSVHQHYFQPSYPEFESRTMWSLSNAFTSSFKELSPTTQFQSTAKLGAFLARFK